MRRRAIGAKKGFRIIWKEAENGPEPIQSSDPISGLISQGILANVIFPMLDLKGVLKVLLASKSIMKASGGRPTILALGSRILEAQRAEKEPIIKAILRTHQHYGWPAFLYRKKEYTLEEFANLKKFWENLLSTRLDFA